MKGPTTTIQKGNFLGPGSWYCKGTAKPDKYFCPCPPILQTLKKFYRSNKHSTIAKCFKKKLTGKYPILKVFLFSFYCSRSHVQQYKSSTQSLNFGKLPIYSATLHIQKHVKSLSKKLHITYKIMINWGTLYHKMSNNNPLLLNRPRNVKFYGGVQIWQL